MQTTTQTSPTLTATYAQLRDGTWGLRIPGRVTAGQSVIAVTRQGRRETHTIGAVLCQSAGDRPALCTIAREAARPLRAQPARHSGRRTGCSCGSREDRLGQLIPSDRNCAGCEHDA